MAILSVKNIKKTYTTRFGGNQVQALKNVTFDVEQGEYVAIMGESGSGQDDAAQYSGRAGQADLSGPVLTGTAGIWPRIKDIRAWLHSGGINLGFVFQEFQSAGHVLPAGQHLSAAGAGWECGYAEHERSRLTADCGKA